MDNYKIIKYLKYKSKYLDMKGGCLLVPDYTNCSGKLIIECLTSLLQKSMKDSTSPILLFSIMSNIHIITYGFFYNNDIHYSNNEIDKENPYKYLQQYINVNFKIFKIDAITVYLTKTLQYYNIIAKKNVIELEKMKEEIYKKTQVYFEQILLYINKDVTVDFLLVLYELLICNFSYYNLDIMDIYLYILYDLIEKKEINVDKSIFINYEDNIYHKKIIEGLLNKIRAISETLLKCISESHITNYKTLVSNINHDLIYQKIMNMDEYTRKMYSSYLEEKNKPSVSESSSVPQVFTFGK